MRKFVCKKDSKTDVITYMEYENLKGFDVHPKKYASFDDMINVDSMVVSFYRKDNKIMLKDINFFYKLVRDSFRFKRKTLRNNLKDYDFDKILNVLKGYGFDLSVRAEQLSVEIFCDIANCLS